MLSIRTKFKIILLLPLEIIWLLVYRLSSQRHKIDMDLDRFCEVHLSESAEMNRYLKLLHELLVYPEFRTLFLFRIGRSRYFLKYILPKGQTNLSFCVPKDCFGGGLFIQHGFSTVWIKRSKWYILIYNSFYCPLLI